MKMSKAQFIQLLDDLKETLMYDDSFEGRLSYVASGYQEFEVEAFYRVGNSMGQGGCVVVEPTKHDRDVSRADAVPDSVTNHADDPKTV